MIRSHALHRDAADERARLAKLARLAREITQDLAEKHAAEVAEHENAIREMARRRVLATLTVEETVEDPDFPGCFW